MRTRRCEGRVAAAVPAAGAPHRRASTARRAWRFLQRARRAELARNDRALDLVRALVNLRDLGVAHEALDGILARVAIAAEDLHGVGRHLHGGVAREALGHRRLHRRDGAAIDERGGVVHRQPRGLRGHRYVGQHDLDPLDGRDRLSELASLLGVADGGVERGLRDAHRLRADRGPRAIERAERDAKALALVAEPIFYRYLAIREMD